MWKAPLFVLLFGSMCGGLACSKEDSKAPEREASAPALERAVEKVGTSGKEAPANECLLAFATRYDELLPLAVAAEATERDVAKAETDYSRVMKNPRYHELKYLWPGGRHQEVDLGAKKLRVPKKDAVALSGIHASTLAEFRSSYRVPEAGAKEKLDELSDESKEKGVDTAEKKDLAKGLGGMLVEIAKAYRRGDGLGDAAPFNDKTMELNVLDRGVALQLRVDVSDDAAVNAKAATSLAKRLLGRCP